MDSVELNANVIVNYWNKSVETIKDWDLHYVYDGLSCFMPFLMAVTTIVVAFTIPPTQKFVRLTMSTPKRQLHFTMGTLLISSLCGRAIGRHCFSIYCPGSYNVERQEMINSGISAGVAIFIGSLMGGLAMMKRPSAARRLAEDNAAITTNNLPPAGPSHDESGLSQFQSAIQTLPGFEITSQNISSNDLIPENEEEFQVGNYDLPNLSNRVEDTPNPTRVEKSPNSNRGRESSTPARVEEPQIHTREFIPSNSHNRRVRKLFEPVPIRRTRATSRGRNGSEGSRVLH